MHGLVRTADRDRYLAALYAPEDKRGALSCALRLQRRNRRHPRPHQRSRCRARSGCNGGATSIARRGPGAGAGHPVAERLLAAIDRHDLPRSAFDNYLDARIFDLYDDPMPSRTDLEGYCGETAAALIQLSAMVLDPDAAPGMRELAGRAGCAQAITGLLRLLPLHRARGQCFVPRDLLAPRARRPRSSWPGSRAAARPRGRRHDRAGARASRAFERGAAALPASLRPAFLPLALTRAYLERQRCEADRQEDGCCRASREAWHDLAAAARAWLMVSGARGRCACRSYGYARGCGRWLGQAKPGPAVRQRARRSWLSLGDDLSLPRRRLPSDFGASTGGNRPKLTFMGWNERFPGSSSETMWPPVM